MKPNPLFFRVAPLILLLPSIEGFTYLNQDLGRISYSDFGGVGLLQMPSGRMAEEGSFALIANRTSPYSHYAFSMQPFSWMGATARFTTISGIPYGEAISDRSYQDKSVDVKFRLFNENMFMPEIAVGMRDIAGTSFFSSEYFAASKRFGPIDLTLGVGWGYMANRAHGGNPFGFGDRKPTNASEQFKDSNYFRGPIAYFGGIEYQTPWRKLKIKAEYDGNDYQNEPRNNNREVDSPVNYGLVYRLTENTNLVLGYERGNTLLAGITWDLNLKKLKSTAKYDIVPTPVIDRRYLPQPADVDWKMVVERLARIGLVVERIEVGRQEVTVYGQFTKVYHQAEIIGLASRILANNAAPSILVFNFVQKVRGLAINEISVRRGHFVAAVTARGDLKDLEYSTEYLETYAKYDYVVYRARPKKFNWSLRPALKLIVGGPDEFALYQVRAIFGADYSFTPNFNISGNIAAGLIDNYDGYVYDGPSTDGVHLPRVRTQIRDYLKGSSAWINNLQFTYTRRLEENWYGMAYAGLLESMYGGGGFELIYRPLNKRFALGFDLNQVRQRDFDRRFDFRDYNTLTGHMTTYFNWKKAGIIMKISAGRYLAKDKGVTLDMARKFKNGVVAGVYATKTDVSAAEFGEGSFDKGIYLRIPLDYMLPWHSKGYAKFNWAPLIRDGGAKLVRKYNLYDMTEDRDSTSFYENISKITGPVAGRQP